MLGTLSYGRDAEREAELMGMNMLHNAKIDPQGMVNFFRTIEEQYGDIPDSLEYISTHPRTGDRIQYLKELSAEKSYEPIILLKGIKWSDLKKSCNSEVKKIDKDKI